MYEAIMEALTTGLPILVVHFLATVALFAVGVFIQVAVSPQHEFTLVRDQGNLAAAVGLGGALVALAIPLYATLATSATLASILVWGTFAVIIQVVAFFVSHWFFPGFKGHIERNNVAVALVVAAMQVSVGLMNAGAMAG